MANRDDGRVRRERGLRKARVTPQIGGVFSNQARGKIKADGGITLALDATQKEKLSALLAQEHVAVLVTRGDKWLTANLQAFAETPEFDLLFIMGANVDKYQNLLKNPEVTVSVDNRDVGKVPSFEITRVWMQGVASEVARGGAEWEALKALFLKKNPFEEPFFKNDGLRMIRIRPARVSYANGLRDTFKAEF
jgi:hypothetical protein